MENKFKVSQSPHIHTRETVSGIMLDVIIALMPAALAGIYYFGYRAALVILTSVAACTASEFFYEKLMKKPITTGDLSAVVTGMLLGMNMPPAIPLYMVVVGSVFAIVVVKQLYGGIGKNFVNPALAARCFMLVAWAGAMTTFSVPRMSADTVASATPLAILKGTSQGTLPTVKNVFFGAAEGCIGETSVLMLLIGFAYLLIRRIISPKIPLAYLLSFAVLIALFGDNSTQLPTLEFVLLHLFSGGLFLGAIFMATDYTTTPTTPTGTLIFGVGCGVLTFVIRRFGGYPEGCSFAILLMNILVPLIEKYTVPRSFGSIRSE